VRRILCLVLVVLAATQPRSTFAADDAAASRLRTSLNALSGIMASPSPIPPSLIQRAKAVVIVPDVLKISFFAGTRFGRGVMVARTEDRQWGNPVFVTLKGGSFGIQAGLQSTDLVLVFLKGTPANSSLREGIFIGADANLVLGNRGIHFDENTSPNLEMEVYSFARTSGVTAGFSLNGMQLGLDDALTAHLYGKPGLKASDVLSGRVSIESKDASRFRSAFLRIIGSSP